MNKFLENSKQPKLSQDEVENLNKPKIEFVIKTIKKDNLQAQMDSLENFTKHSKNYFMLFFSENRGILDSRDLF